uniref:hypothetical protein n=1 Tax=Microbacterium proteolyticum TaxID=1572644 RepID=UPI002417F2F5|nr:hypothetical protein [Microbacterium proteolyticum]
MALAERYARTEPKSKFQTWLDGLAPENYLIVHGWLEDTTIPNARIAQMIRDDDPDDNFTGYPANKDTIAEWRRTHGTR